MHLTTRYQSSVLFWLCWRNKEWIRRTVHTSHRWVQMTAVIPGLQCRTPHPIMSSRNEWSRSTAGHWPTSFRRWTWLSVDCGTRVTRTRSSARSVRRCSTNGTEEICRSTSTEDWRLTARSSEPISTTPTQLQPTHSIPYVHCGRKLSIHSHSTKQKQCRTIHISSSPVCEINLKAGALINLTRIIRPPPSLRDWTQSRPGSAFHFRILPQAAASGVRRTLPFCAFTWGNCCIAACDCGQLPNSRRGNVDP